MKTARFAKVVEECGQPTPHLVLMDPEKDHALQSAIKTNRVMTVFQDATGTKTDRGVVGFEPGRHRQFLVFPRSLSAFAEKSIIAIQYDLLDVSEPPEPKQSAHSPGPVKRPPPAKAGKGKDETAPQSSPEPEPNDQPKPSSSDAKPPSPPPTESAPKRAAKSATEPPPKPTSEEPSPELKPRREIADTSPSKPKSEPAPAGAPPRSGGEDKAKPRPKRKSRTRPKRASKSAAAAKGSRIAPANVVPFHPADDEQETEHEAVLEIKRRIREAMELLEEGKQVAAFNRLRDIVES